MKYLSVLIVALSFLFQSAYAEEKICTNTFAKSQITLLDLSTPTTNTQACAKPVKIAYACCKICRKGKACGNSCISQSKDCHKPPGCACDGG